MNRLCKIKIKRSKRLSSHYNLKCNLTWSLLYFYIVLLRPSMLGLVPLVYFSFQFPIDGAINTCGHRQAIAIIIYCNKAA